MSKHLSVSPIDLGLTGFRRGPVHILVIDRQPQRDTPSLAAAGH